MKKIIDFRILIPNFITLIAICSGLSAIRYAFEGDFHFAVISILIAAALDGIDGRVARALKATSKFGAELDSLADVINFGVVPALILYIWDLKNLGNLGWLACLLFVIAMALRLARFNVGNLAEHDLNSNTSQTVQPKAYFIGVPAPIGAILVLLPIYLSLTGLKIPVAVNASEALYVIMIAGYTISTLKTFSLKAVRFNARNIIPVMFTIACLAALLFSYTWLGLAVMCIMYLTYLLLVTLKFLIKRKRENH